MHSIFIKAVFERYKDIMKGLYIDAMKKELLGQFFAGKNTKILDKSSIKKEIHHYQIQTARRPLKLLKLHKIQRKLGYFLKFLQV